MWPHLTTAEVFAVIGLQAVRMAPDWVLKLITALEAIRRYRR